MFMKYEENRSFHRIGEMKTAFVMALTLVVSSALVIVSMTAGASAAALSPNHVQELATMLAAPHGAQSVIPGDIAIFALMVGAFVAMLIGSAHFGRTLRHDIVNAGRVAPRN